VVRGGTPENPEWRGHYRHEPTDDRWAKLVCDLAGPASDSYFHNAEYGRTSDEVMAEKTAWRIVQAELGSDAFPRTNAGVDAFFKQLNARVSAVVLLIWSWNSFPKHKQQRRPLARA
jgi:hypothetical protein